MIVWTIFVASLFCLCGMILESHLSTISPIFLKTAQNLLDERPYDRKEYNCLNMSLELTRRLRQQGYEAQIVIGDLYYPNNTYRGGHAWVEVTTLLDATNGKIIDVDEYKEFKKAYPPYSGYALSNSTIDEIVYINSGR
jgi:hypothetical protein